MTESLFTTGVSIPSQADVPSLALRVRPDVLKSHAWTTSLALKRGFDLIVSAILLLFLAPVLPVLALVVRLDGGPAFYRHMRVGCNNLPFGCLKFRTMAASADKMLAQHLAANPIAAAEWASDRKLKKDPRITRVGAILRSTSLDELPQLINVMRGEMSLVGPRPVVQEELEQHYGAAGRSAYAAVRPGITGLWQVSGRNETNYPERVRLDVSYASTRSFLLDLKILLHTIPAVLSRRGAL